MKCNDRCAKLLLYFIAICKLMCVCILKADCSGVFELRLKSYDNAQGKGDTGRCCVGSSNTTSDCRLPCRTRFRICLKHYQAKIDTSQCTFGDVMTPILGGNHIDLLDNRHEGFVNPIKFPFDFTWPVCIPYYLLHYILSH